MSSHNKLQRLEKWIHLGALLMTLISGLNSASAASSYELEKFVTLNGIVSDLSAQGYKSLADEFAKSGFHPDGIKVGKACTPTEGKLYVSSIATGSVLEVSKEGKVRPYVNPKPSDAYGVALDHHGNLFVSYISRFTNVGGIDVVLAGSKTPADGKACYAIPNSQVAINDIALTDDGKKLFFTDDAGGRIFRCDVSIAGVSVGCNCKQWLKSANTASFFGVFGGVDGIVIDKDEKNIYFNNFLKGKIYKVAIKADGSPGKEQVLTTNSLYGFADGMSLGADGSTVFAATFDAVSSRVTETDIATGTTQIVIEDVPNTYLSQGSALALDKSGDFETLYISSVDVIGMLFGYKNIGSDGGQIVKATLTDRPVTSDDNHCD